MYLTPPVNVHILQLFREINNKYEITIPYDIIYIILNFINQSTLFYHKNIILFHCLKYKYLNYFNENIEKDIFKIRIPINRNIEWSITNHSNKSQQLLKTRGLFGLDLIRHVLMIQIKVLNEPDYLFMYDEHQNIVLASKERTYLYLNTNSWEEIIEDYNDYKMLHWPRLIIDNHGDTNYL